MHAQAQEGGLEGSGRLHTSGFRVDGTIAHGGGSDGPPYNLHESTVL